MTAHGKEWQEFLTKEIKVQEAKLDDREEVLEADETENGGVPLFNLNTHKKRKSSFQQNLPDMAESKMTYGATDPRAKQSTKEYLQ